MRASCSLGCFRCCDVTNYKGWLVSTPLPSTQARVAPGRYLVQAPSADFGALWPALCWSMSKRTETSALKEATMTFRWEFDQGKESKEWRWLRIDADRRQIWSSRESFKTLRDCQRDAAQNGYLPARGERPPIERRVTPPQYSIPPFVERRRYA